jgi:hypothetical protein
MFKLENLKERGHMEINVGVWHFVVFYNTKLKVTFLLVDITLL